MVIITRFYYTCMPNIIKWQIIYWEKKYLRFFTDIAVFVWTELIHPFKVGSSIYIHAVFYSIVIVWLVSVPVCIVYLTTHWFPYPNIFYCPIRTAYPVLVKSFKYMDGNFTCGTEMNIRIYLSISIGALLSSNMLIPFK